MFQQTTHTSKFGSRPLVTPQYSRAALRTTSAPPSVGFWTGICLFVCLCGCVPWAGYSQQSLFPQDVDTIYLHMFDNRTFWRNMEYDLTDALAKRIEARTPYKIVSDPDLADTVMTGQITSVSQGVLMTDRDTGNSVEQELILRAVVSWKNYKTGALLADNETVVASASFSTALQQHQAYGSKLATNRLAVKIVELMETRW